jgi:hypothetical protein
MKHVTTMAALFCALSLGAAQAAPAGVDTMRQAFASALAAKHIEAAMAMTRFPLIQEVYQAPPKVTAAQFGKELSSMGLDDAGVQKCIAHDPLSLTPAKDVSNKGFIGAWNTNCNGSIYYFAQKNGAWMFIGYENINE